MAAAQPAAATPAPDWQSSPLRHEIKYEGPAGLADHTIARLDSLCVPDPAFPSNRVHSIYFDTPRLAAYEHKADGQYHKEKVRLRWYTPGSSTAWLEIKTRMGSLGAKRRKPVAFAPPETGADVDEAAWTSLLREHLSVSLRPVLWLDYARRRWVTPDGSARIAVDDDIQLRWASPLLAARRPPDRLPLFVAEVKGPGADPPAWLVRALTGVRRTALSKYALCVEHARGGCT